MPDVQAGHKINEAHKTPNQHHSNFNLSVKRALTPRFGVNTPFYSKEVVPDDGPISIEPSSMTRSYTLKAPLLADVNKHVSFYQVPLQAILPFNWEKIVKQADRGTDVQNVESGEGVVSALNGVNCVVSQFPYRLALCLTSDFSVLQSNITTALTGNDIQSYIRNILHFVIRWEMFFSNGSLLSYLGVHYGYSLKFVDSGNSTGTYSFDSFCQLLLDSISYYEFGIVDDGGTASVSKSSGIPHVRKVLEFMRQHVGPFTISTDETIFNTESIDAADFNFSHSIEADCEPLNFGRLAAYQIVNAHYLTNSKIDYIYNAELYRQYIGSLLTSINGNAVSRFTYNGILCTYDWLSGFYFNLLLGIPGSSGFVNRDYLDSDLWEDYIPYFNAIFGFNYSLRYMDYFVGARPRNYAIGNQTVQVSGGQVSVVDTTKGIVRQRYLNAVARVKQNIEDYSKELFGTRIAPDWHDPKYLFSYDEVIYGSEVENTAEGQLTEQNSVTSVLRGKSGNHRFTFDIDRHSFIIGIEYFDIRRFYFTTQPKSTMAIDRFDMFVPQLQYVGDQGLSQSVLLAGRAKSGMFGYQLRDMEFKQDFDDCAGGFVEDLPGWLFKFDPTKMKSGQLTDLVISPEFIRSQPCELDEFYLSLTGLTLASYFHFIEVWDIKVNANRPMAYAPEIL